MHASISYIVYDLPQMHCNLDLPKYCITDKPARPMTKVLVPKIVRESLQILHVEMIL